METSGKTLKIASLFLLFIFGLLIFLGAIFKIVVDDRKLPKLVISEKNRAIRGSIVSKDGYQLAYSNKLYKVGVDTRCIDPAKKELFINLVSIYSDVPKKVIRKKLRTKGYVVLSYNIDTKRAYQLKLLSRKLYRMDMFVPYRKGDSFTIRGLEVIESGETRRYPYKDTLEPVLGYVRKYDKKGYTVVDSFETKGLERYYRKYLLAKQDGLIKGKRDIGNNIILNKEAVIKKRIDGYNVHLNVDMLLQKSIENIIDNHKSDLDAKEIIAAVMESSTGRIIAIASTNRYNPKKKRKKDIPNLSAKVVEYSFEPGSVMKPVTFALLLEHRLVNPYEVVRGYNGRYKLGRKIITDEHKEAWLSAENVIVHSSNIGIAQLAQRLKYDQFYHGLKKFGFAQKTGIDLPNEHVGSLIPIYKFKSEIYKATVGYGYGMRATFMQLLKAYNVFNNEGWAISPRIAAFLSDQRGKKKELPPQKRTQVLSSKTANTMREILKKVVKKGTATLTDIEGLEIGGKTGTAHIARGGRYVRAYNSSFFGFANDAKHRYTIGVTVIEPKEKYFASQTAVPVFRDIVMELVNEGYLSIER